MTASPIGHLTAETITDLQIASLRAGAVAVAALQLVADCDLAMSSASGFAAHTLRTMARRRLAGHLNAADLAITESHERPDRTAPSTRPMSTTRVLLDPVDGRDGRLAEVIVLAPEGSPLRRLMVAWLHEAIPSHVAGVFTAAAVRHAGDIVGWWIEAERVRLDGLAAALGVKFNLSWAAKGAGAIGDGVWLGEREALV